MRLLLTIDSLDPSAGGTTQAVTQLAGALRDAGADVHLAARVAGSGAPGDVVPTVLTGGLSGWQRHLEAVEPDLVHDHGLWLPVNRAVAAAGRRLGIPRVVSTHGMLSPWALRRHAWRKRAAWRLFQRRDLAAAAAVHATSEAEAADVRASGATTRVHVVPHGVRLPAPRAPRVGGARTALFLGRLHPVKGLPALVDAWAEVRPAGWELVIAGPDPEGLGGELERQRDAAGITDSVRMEGYMSAARRDELLAGADLFILPSLSENFGVAVAEALAASVPVIVSDRAPWASVEAEGAGWSVPPEVPSLSEALRAATAMTDDERAAMGARGRRMAERDLAWPAIARRMLDLYAEAAAGASRA